MKIQTTIPYFITRLSSLTMKIKISIFKLFILVTYTLLIARATGIPEPGLVMYGVVRNAASGNARLVSGTINWTITPASGSSVTITTPLTDISGQYSYALRVPFESVVGSSTLLNEVSNCQSR